MWVSWVNGARRGDDGARDELAGYFTPFVHGILIAHVAAHIANDMVKAVLDDVFRRISEIKSDFGFATLVLDTARRRAQQMARSPGATLEMIGGGATITEGKKALAKLRQLPEGTRERLTFRMLEGIPGAEIAEVTGAAPNEVRADLERGLTAWLRELGGQAPGFAGDNYLWSMTGSPPPGVVQLENQLTALRHDPTPLDGANTDDISAQVAAAASSLEITPVSGERYDQEKGEGKRPTGEQSVIVELTPEPDVIDEKTNLLDAVRPLPQRPGGYERTQHSADLPAAARENPFSNQPGTLPASDLPAAAHIDRQSKPRPAVPVAPALGEGEAPPTQVRPQPPPKASGVFDPTTRRIEKVERGIDDTTDPRGLPPAVARAYESPDTGSLTPSQPHGQDWRGSMMDARTTPNPSQRKPTGFSLTRGSTPFVMAVVFFAFFVAIAYVNIRGTERGVRRNWNLVPVTVAAQNIPEGAVVDYDMISTRQVPDQFVTASVVKPDSAQYIVNQRIMVPVQAGDPLLWTQFETARASERLSRKVNKRGRAYTLDARTAVSVGGWVRPGDHVDLVVTVRDEGTQLKTATTTLQNLVVLATGKLTQTTNFGTIKGNQAEYSNVSLLALPEEIEILALMREKASYRMLLRNEEDYEPVEAGKSTPDTLINGERVAAMQKKRFQTIQLIRNTPHPAPDAAQATPRR